MARHSQFHRDRLVNNLASTGEAWRNQVNALTQALTPSSGYLTAHAQAIGEIGRQLQRQADLMSYIDDFRYMALACICCVPFVWMLKRIKKSATNMPVH